MLSKEERELIANLGIRLVPPVDDDTIVEIEDRVGDLLVAHSYSDGRVEEVGELCYSILYNIDNIQAEINSPEAQRIQAIRSRLQVAMQSP